MQPWPNEQRHAITSRRSLEMTLRNRNLNPVGVFRYTYQWCVRSTMGKKVKGMNTPDFTKLFADNWPSFFGPLIGSTIGHIVMVVHRRPDVARIRRELGRALNRFAHVPPDRLDPALLTAAQATQRGWGGVVSILFTAFWFIAALFSAELYRTLFPDLPRWQSLVVCCVVAGLLASATLGIERRWILRKLERLHNETGNDYLGSASNELKPARWPRRWSTR
jgi:hypothetical protein